MKPQMSTKKPLQSRHRVNGAAAANGQQQPGACPAVPRMLRRMTKQSFMDVDLQYLMRLDPTTPDPFENSSSIFDDPPSLFRPLPASIIGSGIAGTGQWMSAEAIRLQKEQEDLRVQYLQFLHQLNHTNPHSYLVHMNAFATEFPQEFAQLQAYIRYQEQVMNQQREEARRQEEMRQYQLQLEQRRQQEEELNQFKQFREMQSRQEHVQEMQELLQEWLLKRQHARATSFRMGTNHRDDGLDLADVITIALQKDPKLMERVLSTAGPEQGLNLILTPAQQQEFGQFLQQKRIQELLAIEKKRQDMAAAGFSNFAFQPSLSSSSSPFLAAGMFNTNFGIGSSSDSWASNFGSGSVFPSRIPMTSETKRTSKGSLHQKYRK
ncbi:hypothetical protein BCR41DRAFT_361889 [Lobosporangium transversale]|uniref:Uncharacterized protein n=1 Tax=Lobosporangium transversale TaxID=64571 RepID=A0A1Y2GCL4_9FUNG|nr:hypothetical protein BCR41DRAFT_361889 [Lobosporangium transversale]ORZ05320.1 hypothetical protein BCR41DRAFT_361889 [Lobosporangium transversale]|eukprot:XP_021877012.1 hypothetical protein BCR41DRAFT_361889 [Lobosporangium transversale]